MDKVFSFNSELHKVTGVQRVLLDIHSAIKENYEAKIVGFRSYKQVNKNLGIIRGEYVAWRNPLMFYNSIVLLHERKFLVLFWLLNTFLFQRIKIVYIHHNLLFGHKLLSIMPKCVVCIADKGKKNLIDEFRVPQDNIHKIYNCTRDTCIRHSLIPHKDVIRILYPARINETKRQLELVENLNGKIHKNVKILFAGDGPLYEPLINKVGDNNPNFCCLGFVSDIQELMMECDYVMLFSKHEGLPVSLIEATMIGIPIICNDVGGNEEIAFNGENAIVINEWNELLVTLNSLSQIDNGKYSSMCKKGREIFELNFTYERFKKQYLNLLDSL